MPAFNRSFLTPAIRAVQNQHLIRLEALWNGIQPEHVLALDGIWFGRSHGLSGVNDIDMLEEPVAWLEDVLADMALQADRLADPLTFRPPVIELDPLGVHFMDALFGAETRFHGGQVWSGELPGDLDDLRGPDLSRSVLFSQAQRLAELAVQASGGEIFIATPVFACAINIAINLFGERLLEALHTRPESVRRALAVINETILDATRRICAVIPAEIRRNSVAENRLAPAGVGQFDGCATQLISRRDYVTFFAGLDEKLLAFNPRGGLLHLCGAHRQHIPVWREMQGLRAFQLNDRAMDDLEMYYMDLRSDTIFYLSPSENVPVERIMEITGGRRVVLQSTLDRHIPVQSKL